MNYADLHNPIKTPQSEPIPGAAQVQNNAGGYAYQIDDWARLERFLILGSDKPTYYQTARELTRENAEAVTRCFAVDGLRTVEVIQRISMLGRAPKNDPAIFALALGVLSADVAVRQACYGAVPSVCRTGTHLFQFVDYARRMGKGFGRGLKRAVANWYDKKPIDIVAYQAVKYRQRYGYTHARLLKQAHPAGDGTPERDALYRWMVGKEAGPEAPPIVNAHLLAMLSDKPGSLVSLIERNHLPWEALPTWALKDPDVWKAMLPSMPLMAMIRNLGRMTEIGAIAPLSRQVDTVVEALTDEENLIRSRVHPFSILLAHRVYDTGRGYRGGGQWTPIPQVVDALNEAFYKAFQNVQPTGKRHLLALDISGSMGGAKIAGTDLSAREASAAMALVTMAAEKNVAIAVFDTHFSFINISPKMRLSDVVEKISRLRMGATDCALPMLDSARKGTEVDAFVVYTDNETWFGDIHPSQALQLYRRQTGINAKLAVVGMTSTGFSIADPNDGGMMDFVGFDAAAPAVMADFIR